MDKAVVADTLAIDALASIDARADESTDNMAKARKLQDDFEELKFSLDATKKALDEIDASKNQRREKREGEKEEIDGADFGGRLEKLATQDERMNVLRDSIKEMLNTLKDRLDDARGNISR